MRGEGRRVGVPKRNWGEPRQNSLLNVVIMIATKGGSGKREIKV